MRRFALFSLSLTLFALLLAAQGQRSRTDEAMGHGLPDLKQSQLQELLKEDKKKSIQDTSEILDRAGKLKSELESNDHQVLSMKALKEAEEIEKLAKRIRGRMRRF